jgi:endonuclease/exonuclease/phosphatase family metal-dependent hydrolase
LGLRESQKLVGDVLAPTDHYAWARYSHGDTWLGRFTVEEKGRVRVATLNLWGQNGAWEERRSALVEGLSGLQPDLIAFQEAIVGDGYDQVEDVLGPGYHVVHQNVGLVGDGNHGASIASRWPLGEVSEADLHLTPRTGDYPCGTLIAEVLAPDSLGTFLFVCHGPSHQLSYEYERELQAVAAARMVEELAERVGAHHVVVGGDFNADRDANSVAFWRGERSLEGMSVCYWDAWERARPGEAGHTFTPRNPLVSENKPAPGRDRRMDYLLVRCEDSLYGPTLEVSSCELAFDKPVEGVWGSDHFGVVADLSA